jgi:hypothetical protein
MIYVFDTLDYGRVEIDTDTWTAYFASSGRDLRNRSAHQRVQGLQRDGFLLPPAGAVHAMQGRDPPSLGTKDHRP